MTDPSHLERALTFTVRGKRRRRDVAWLLFRREEELARIRQELVAGRWQPEGFERIFVRDPKPRLIARAPIADRVVHTALVMAMEPVLTRSLRPECYACRPGLGTHRAVLCLHRHMRRRSWFVQLDVRAYFPSIDRDILRGLLADRIDDAAFLEVVRRVLDSGAGLYVDPGVRAFARLDPNWPPPGRGLPIGAYTSQVFAAWLYLDVLDHLVARTLCPGGYLRYVDDIFLFGRSRRDLEGVRDRVAAWLSDERGLLLKRPQARPRSCRGTLHALGHAISREGIRPLPRTLRRLRGRLAAHAAGQPGPNLGRVVASSVGVAMFGAVSEGDAGVPPPARSDR